MTEGQAIPQPGQGRLVSLDAFRGMTIIAMLWVNNPGHPHAYWNQFRHAKWGEAITFCDLIFPWFLFIVGVAIPWSAASFWRRNPGAKMRHYTARLAQRGIILILLGIFIDCTVNKRIVIGMNVLQLIGFAFFCGALLYELPRKARLAVAAGLLVSYWGLLRLVPHPDVGHFLFEQNKTIVNWLNDQLRPYKLAGILSVIPTAALVVIGTAFGELLRDAGRPQVDKLKWMAIAGAILCGVGIAWHFSIEMNKFVWTPSYIVFSAGLGAIVLGVFYWIMDMVGWKRWAFPMVVFGMNAITAYFISIVVRMNTLQLWTTTLEDGTTVSLWRWLLLFWSEHFGEIVGSWIFTGSYIAFWFFVLWWLYRKGWFWRV